jgi:hypothetical protein
MIGAKEKVAMFDDNIYHDYASIVNDTDPLYEDEDYVDEYDYDYDFNNEREFDCYYHNITDELID